MDKLKKIVNNNECSKVRIYSDIENNKNLKYSAKKIAFKIFYALKDQNKSQRDLAELLNVTPQNVSKLLRGDDYKISTLIKIENVLSINLLDRNIKSDINKTYIFIKSYSKKQKANIEQSDINLIKSVLNNYETFQTEIFTKKDRINYF